MNKEKPRPILTPEQKSQFQKDHVIVRLNAAAVGEFWESIYRIRVLQTHFELGLTWEEYLKQFVPWKTRTAVENALYQLANKMPELTSGEDKTETNAKVTNVLPSRTDRAGNDSKESNKSDSSTPTVKSVIAAARAITSGPAKQLDQEGNIIPEHALKFWNRKQEVQDVLTAISRIRSDLKKKIEARDTMWCKQGTDQRLYAELSSVYTTVQNFLPYAVCVVCQGHVANKSCESFHVTGLVSESHYKNFSDKRAIEIRKAERNHVRP
jgi:hypothetical protein